MKMNMITNFKQGRLIAFVLISMLFFSCKEEVSENFSFVICNESNDTIFAFFEKINQGVSSGLERNGAILPPSSGVRHSISWNRYEPRADNGIKLIVINLSKCNHKFDTNINSISIEQGHVMYYSLEELRAMDWTIVYDGSLE